MNLLSFRRLQLVTGRLWASRRRVAAMIDLRALRKSRQRVVHLRAAAHVLTKGRELSDEGGVLLQPWRRLNTVVVAREVTCNGEANDAPIWVQAAVAENSTTCPAGLCV